jgi:hypothetical protein
LRRYSHIQRVPFLCQVVADHQLHQQACLLIRSGCDDMRLFPSVAKEFDCPQSDRRTSAALAAASLCSRGDMRALILAHLRDSSRNVRSAVATALNAYPYDNLPAFELHSVALCLCVSLQLESVPEVVAALMLTLAGIFPRLYSVPRVILEAMQQHPAVFDLLSHWICQTHIQPPEAPSVADHDCGESTFGPDFLTLEQLLHELTAMKGCEPFLPPSISCKLVLISAVISGSHGIAINVSPDVAVRSGVGRAHMSSFLAAAAASVGPRPSPPPPAPHSCLCSFIRMCGSKHFIPLFLQVDVPRLFLLAGLRGGGSRPACMGDDKENVGVGVPLSIRTIDLPSREDFKLQTVSFSLQTYFVNAATNEVILAADFPPSLNETIPIDAQEEAVSRAAVEGETAGPLEVVRAQLVNELVLELVCAVQQCVETLPKDDTQLIASACQGACAFAYSIISGASSFEICDDLLCQALSLAASAGVVAVFLAATTHKFSVTLQALMDAILSCASHSRCRVRVAALNVLCSEFVSFVRNRAADYSSFCQNHLEMFASVRRALLAAVNDEADVVVATALNCLASVLSLDSEIAGVLFDCVAAALKDALTFCLSKSDSRSKAAAKVQVLLEHTASSLFSDSPPDLPRIERSCVEIRRICKWFPSSHKPPLCAQQLRLQALKVASSLLSSKRLCSQVSSDRGACNVSRVLCVCAGQGA